MRAIAAALGAAGLLASEALAVNPFKDAYWRRFEGPEPMASPPGVFKCHTRAQGWARKRSITAFSSAALMRVNSFVPSSWTVAARSKGSSSYILPPRK